MKKQTKKPKAKKYDGGETELLQFQCERCGMQTYINLDDDLLEEFPERVRCINCGKKESIKKRIFEMLYLDHKSYPKKCPTCGREE